MGDIEAIRSHDEQRARNAIFLRGLVRQGTHNRLVEAFEAVADLLREDGEELTLEAIDAAAGEAGVELFGLTGVSLEEDDS